MSSFFVHGRPAPQGSKSYKGMRKGKPVLVESSKALKPWRAVVTAEAHVHYRKQPLMTGPVALNLMFVMPRPASMPKGKPTPPAVKRIGDTDKLARGVLDALEGALYVDDAQVTDLRARKRYAEVGELPGVHITYTEIFAEQVVAA
ncbi:RusA family crossover junction endodeoxyribonuclease [Rhodococcoides fascians]|uniref:RusA family crossover junction endodeoxyribonuclease n=1 Tax=Rhodococcoides fascians TaxID=1828 RepID=UPI00056C889A|nr:RusA family crossover junction endodeoxyribonuclease [Rhodococcus fascians]